MAMAQHEIQKRLSLFSLKNSLPAVNLRFYSSSVVSYLLEAEFLEAFISRVRLLEVFAHCI